MDDVGFVMLNEVKHLAHGGRAGEYDGDVAFDAQILRYAQDDRKEGHRI
jgi:hypothetical protein